MPANVVVYGAIVLFLAIALVFFAYYFWKVRGQVDSSYHGSEAWVRHAEKESPREPRWPVSWPVSIETSDGTIAAELRNISLGGAFVCCEKPFPIGEVFRLTLTGRDDEIVTATAKVVWSNANLAQETVIHRGMGVRFISISDKQIQWVRQISQDQE